MKAVNLKNFLTLCLSTLCASVCLAQGQGVIKSPSTSTSSSSAPATTLVYYYYDEANFGIPKQELLKELKKASDIWKIGCAIEFVPTTDPTLASGRVIWGDLPSAAATATVGNGLSAPKNFTLTLSTQHAKVRSFHSSLKWTLVHEMGHLIGLNHNATAHSVMNIRANRSNFTSLSEADSQACEQIKKKWKHV